MINTADIKTINFNDLDFLSSDIDDLTLSQICDTIETEYHMTNELNSLKIDQFGDFEIETAIDTLLEVGPSATTGCFMHFARFADPVSDEDVRKLIEGQENQNTKKNTKWAVGVWEKWRASRIKMGTAVQELRNMTTKDMNFYLGRIIIEARKQDGTPYTPRSLYLISCGLLCHLRDCRAFDKNFLDMNNLKFTDFQKILDSRMKELLSMGHGTSIKQAPAVLSDDESVIWEKEAFGDKTAESLQHTVFFLFLQTFWITGSRRALRIGM